MPFNECEMCLVALAPERQRPPPTNGAAACAKCVYLSLCHPSDITVWVGLLFVLLLFPAHIFPSGLAKDGKSCYLALNTWVAIYATVDQHTVRDMVLTVHYQIKGTRTQLQYQLPYRYGGAECKNNRKINLILNFISTAIRKKRIAS